MPLTPYKSDVEGAVPADISSGLEQFGGYTKNINQTNPLTSSHRHTTQDMAEGCPSQHQAMDMSRGTSFPAVHYGPTWLGANQITPSLHQTARARVIMRGRQLSLSEDENDKVDASADDETQQSPCTEASWTEYLRKESFDYPPEINSKTASFRCGNKGHEEANHSYRETEFEGAPTGMKQVRLKRSFGASDSTREKLRRSLVAEIDHKKCKISMGCRENSERGSFSSKDDDSMNPIPALAPFDPFYGARKLSATLQQIMESAPPAADKRSLCNLQTPEARKASNCTDNLQVPWESSRCSSSSYGIPQNIVPPWLERGMAGLPANVTLAPGSRFELKMADCVEVSSKPTSAPHTLTATQLFHVDATKSVGNYITQGRVMPLPQDRGPTDRLASGSREQKQEYLSLNNQTYGYQPSESECENPSGDNNKNTALTLQEASKDARGLLYPDSEQQSNTHIWMNRYQQELGVMTADMYNDRAKARGTAVACNVPGLSDSATMKNLGAGKAQRTTWQWPKGTGAVVTHKSNNASESQNAHSNSTFKGKRKSEDSHESHSPSSKKRKPLNYDREGSPDVPSCEYGSLTSKLHYY